MSVAVREVCELWEMLCIDACAIVVGAFDSFADLLNGLLHIAGDGACAGTITASSRRFPAGNAATKIEMLRFVV